LSTRDGWATRGILQQPLMDRVRKAIKHELGAGYLHYELKQIAEPTGEFDALIAAVARSSGDIVVARNMSSNTLDVVVSKFGVEDDKYRVTRHVTGRTDGGASTSMTVSSFQLSWDATLTYLYTSLSVYVSLCCQRHLTDLARSQSSHKRSGLPGQSAITLSALLLRSRRSAIALRAIHQQRRHLLGALAYEPLCHRNCPLHCAAP
jgi:hypothetical protein